MYTYNCNRCGYKTYSFKLLYLDFFLYSLSVYLLSLPTCQFGFICGVVVVKINGTNVRKLITICKHVYLKAFWLQMVTAGKTTGACRDIVIVILTGRRR